MTKRTIRDEAELESIARDILAKLTESHTAQVVTLQGDLGAGKTALTKAIARVLGIPEHITSPTFVIMKSYGVEKHDFVTTLTHIDAYRVDTEDEMRVLGFDELCKDPHRLICIEWPERIAGLIPKDVLAVSITIERTGERTITYGE